MQGIIVWVDFAIFQNLEYVFLIPSGFKVSLYWMISCYSNVGFHVWLGPPLLQLSICFPCSMFSCSKYNMLWKHSLMVLSIWCLTDLFGISLELISIFLQFYWKCFLCLWREKYDIFMVSNGSPIFCLCILRDYHWPILNYSVHWLCL